MSHGQSTGEIERICKSTNMVDYQHMSHNNWPMKLKEFCQSINFVG